VKLLRSIRALLRLAGWGLLTVAFALLWLAGLPLVALFSNWRRWRRVCFGGWARCCLFQSGVRFEQRGPRVQGGGCLVANHQSWLDIPVLAARFDVVFVSMAELGRWPLIGSMAWAFGTILIDRSDKRSIPEVNERIAKALARGDRVAFFPEAGIGTLREPRPFRAALFEAAAQGFSGVRCVALSYSSGPGDDRVEDAVVWGNRPFLLQVWRLALQNRITARVQVAGVEARAKDRKQLALQCEALVRAELGLPEKLEGAVAGAFEV
jgi:1-acyl-sn-glycerol-3-phosphate acyltransferase